MRRKGLSPVAGYALSIALHLAIFGWAWALPSRRPGEKHVDVQIVETFKPKPVEPKPDPPEPPKQAEPVRVRSPRKVAMAAPPPDRPPPPEAPPAPEPPAAHTAPTPGPVHLGLSLASTSEGGAFAAPVGNSLAGKPATRAASAADDIGPVAHATQVTTLPEAVDTDIPKDEYPKAALDAGFEGAVELKVVIDASGRVRRASVLKDPGYGLGAAAVKIATKYFRFKPGLRDGKAVATEIPFTVYFELP
jgi:periplasmic protein TonB